ncbi:hypothetical protein [Actinacidiphila guanduensis]|jgi:hypothetical protein|uniref:Uncharacterized protein n=1 Tax=Actinacidiphila guanduensis TaxID=310781 RepID=A0A1H0FDH2_9ACTN|nr:hypothetical protein [Actinacidiphila guanduensis]SDN92703.1 hypothetical protein SAMN05216259_106252 [Actinacidiphila guanduensis]
MASTTLTPAPAPNGGTAIGPHPRHLIGNALRAARVYLKTAVEVVILGADAKRF